MIIGKRKNLIASAVLVFVFIFSFSAPANAADVNLGEAGQILEEIPTSIGGAVSGFYDKADGWFFNTTNLHLKDAVRAILEVFIGILSFLLDILKWIFSLVQ